MTCELAPEPVTRSCDNGQRIPCFDSCQLTIIWMSVIKLSTGYMLPHYRESLTFHIDCPMCGRMDGHVIIKISRMGKLTNFLRGCLHEKTRTGASFIPRWLGHFISRYLKVHFMLIKYTCDSKSQTLRMRYPFQSTGRPISHRNWWSFRVYMIPLWDFVPEWNSRPGTTTGVNSRRDDSCRHDILWWYHLNKCRAMRGNRS